MKIKSHLVYLGKEFELEYQDVESFDDLPYEQCRQVYGLGFYDGKLVIGHGGNKQDWGLIGGTIEPGESFRETLDREIKEESNMKVLDAKPIGYQMVTDQVGKSIYQLRYWARVEPYGKFVADHDTAPGSITRIKLIDPADYKSYFDWGAIGQRLVERAVDMNQQTSAK